MHASNGRSAAGAVGNETSVLQRAIPPPLGPQAPPNKGQQQLIPLQDAIKRTQGIRTVYERLVMLVRRFLPEIKSTIITSPWLQRVRSMQVILPKYEDLKIRPCVNQPNKDYLTAEIQRIGG